jgi:D-beta-D-heptose 7-phosphate kinase/D-beta-D-heptose 1-phosphate adenosyltransferase
MRKVYIIGDVMMDINYICHANRIAQEACIPVLNKKYETKSLGGATNVFQNLVNIGVSTCIISVIGDDDIGHELKDHVTRICHNTFSSHFLIEDDRRITTSKHRFYVNKKIVFRYDDEYVKEISKTIENKILLYFCNVIKPNDIVVLSDYNKGVLTETLTKKIIKISNATNAKVFVDPKVVNITKYAGCFLIKPNQNEGEVICKHDISIDNLQTSTKEICDVTKSQNCLLTLGKNGLAIYQSLIDSLNYDKIEPTSIIDITGAGDVVLAGFVYMFMKTNDPIISAHFSNYCGQNKVKQFGTYIIEPYDIVMYERSIKKYYSDSEIVHIANILKGHNKKIVMTNGCFDILHFGHLKFLNDAKKLGDILIVAINTDNSVTLNKGFDRPINKLEERVRQLSELSSIDLIVSFDDKTPLNIIKQLQPDILVKGGDYNINDIIGREYAKQTITLNYNDGFSTSNIIKKCFSK